MSENFQPCPFCGKTSAIRFTRASEGYEEWDCRNDDYYAVVCDASSYDGAGAGGCGAQSGFAPSRDQAFKKWQDRAQTLEQLTAESERLGLYEGEFRVPERGDT